MNSISALASTIESQPGVLRAVLDLEIDEAVGAIAEAETIWLVGTGTSQHAAELGARLLAEGGRDARWASSASYARSAKAPSGTDAVIVISHTGETAFSQAARDRTREAGAALVSLTGAGSGWVGAVEVAPREQSETYTASYTAVLLYLARIHRLLGGSLGMEELESIPAEVERALADSQLHALEPPRRLLTMIGAGYASVTAREGALKCREAAHAVAEGFESEYFLHGQAVPFGTEDALVLIAPSLDPDGLTAALGIAASAAGSPVAAIDAGADLHPFLAQIPLTVQLQRLAATLADHRGTDPDRVITGPWADEGLWALGRGGD